MESAISLNLAARKRIVLKIVENAFETRNKSDPSGDQEFVILYREYLASKMPFPDFAVTLHLLAEDFPGTTVKPYDFSNGERPNEPQELDVAFHAVVHLTVRSDFDAQIKSYRQSGDANAHNTRGKEIYRIEIKKRQIILNGSHILTRPDFDSENDTFISLVFENPGQTLRKADFKLGPKVEFKKDFHQIVRDLKFRDGLQTLFFPSISSTAVIFRNPVYEKDMEMNPKELKKLEQYIKSLQVVKKAKKK